MKDFDKDKASIMVQLEGNDEKLLDNQNPEIQETIELIKKACAKATGIKDPEAALTLVTQIHSANSKNEKDKVEKFRFILEFMSMLNPQNPLVTMLLGQALTFHFKGMDWFEKGEKRFDYDFRERCERQAERLFRAYRSHLMALIKYLSDSSQFKQNRKDEGK